MKYWMWLEAIDWKWDLRTVMEQDEVLMNDIAEIASAHSLIYRMARKDREKGNK